MKEFYLDDFTGIGKDSKGEAEKTILFNIVNILEGGDENTIVDEVVEGLDYRDIYEFMMFLSETESIPQKLTRITHYLVQDPDLFSKLVEYTSISDPYIDANRNMRIFFVETEDFALTVIPVALSKKKINIYMEPLEASPDLVTEIWAGVVDKKNLENIKFVNPKDLKRIPKSRT